MKIEMKNGRKIKSFIRTGQGGSCRPAPNTNHKDKEYFRCGRKGHIRPDCRVVKYINGGPPKEHKKKGSNLEGSESCEEYLQPIELCPIELTNGFGELAEEEDEEEGEDTDEEMESPEVR